MINDRASRRGAELWKEWNSDSPYADSDNKLIFYTEEHVDLTEEVVNDSLAMCLQRHGVVMSLSHGYRAIEISTIRYGYAGYLDGDDDLTECDENGNTDRGDTVSDVEDITWVEVSTNE